MRVWYPIPVHHLDDARLRGEHHEIHVIYSVIVNNRKGYSKHPETMRWRNYLPALIKRHDLVVKEAHIRGVIQLHKSPLPSIDDDINWPEPIEPIEVMKSKLESKILASKTKSF